jgi:selenocysteine lyase/cysteine desulfurase
MAVAAVETALWDLYGKLSKQTMRELIGAQEQWSGWRDASPCPKGMAPGGAVIGLSEVLDVHQPAFYGGGTVHLVRDYEVEYKSGQEAYEAGSPNYPGVVGLGKAIDVLQQIGFDKIAEHEQQLTRRMVEGLQAIPNVTVYGDTEDLDSRVGVVSFNTSEANSYELAYRMAEKSGVATRRGAFCAHPYVWRLMGYSDEEMVAFEGCNDFKTPGLIRVSFGIYNTEEEVDEFLKVLKENIEAIKVHNAELNAKELWDDVMPEEY